MPTLANPLRILSATLPLLLAPALASQSPSPETPEPARLAPNANDGSGLPDLGFEVVPGETALVITDPQNDFLHEDGVAWGVVGQSVKENGTVDNIEKLFVAAKAGGLPVFISPHYYYPHDHGWHMEGALERVMHSIHMFDRPSPLSTQGFAGSGADWLERYKPYIEDGQTIVTSPHKVYGPESNDLVLQLRKRGISRVLLGGMSANLCCESHMRELVEEGFDVAVVADATAAAKVPGYDGYRAAYTNYRMIASSVWTTDQAVHEITRSGAATVAYGHVDVDGVKVAFREVGDPSAPQIVLLHGFPTSSHMFRALIPQLARRFHVIAPDYPGFGLSDQPAREDFDYTFANLAKVVKRVLDARGFDSYTLYLMDYGAPIGFRLATAAPENVAGLIIQNGNAYEEGLREFWNPIRELWTNNTDKERQALRKLLTLEATKWQYQHGTRHPGAISPDNWLVDQPLLDRPGNQEIQLDLFYDYRTNVPLYGSWQTWLREQQPPTLIVWGKNDHIFPAEGAHPYLRDLPKAELHLLDTGHFALEEDGERIAALIAEFMAAKVAQHASAPR
ncbi:MAG: alpha/beta fold hydrolase [Planctomycetota bacterium]